MLDKVGYTIADTLIANGRRSQVCAVTVENRSTRQNKPDSPYILRQLGNATGLPGDLFGTA